jgi:hypothetical protein
MSSSTNQGGEMHQDGTHAWSRRTALKVEQEQDKSSALKARIDNTCKITISGT